MWSYLSYRTAAGRCDCDNKGRLLRFKCQTLCLYAATSVLVRFQPVWQLGFIIFGARSEDPQWSPSTEMINSKGITHVYWISFLFSSVLEHFSEGSKPFFFIYRPRWSHHSPLVPTVTPLFPFSYNKFRLYYIQQCYCHRVGLPINRELPEGLPNGTVTEISASWQAHNKHYNKSITQLN